MPDKSDVELKTFNTAKKFAEEILFPLMEQYQQCQRKANYGANTPEEALLLSEEVRDIERYNGLKGMNDNTEALLYAISSTVNLKGNTAEREARDKFLVIIKKISNLFHEHKELFFKPTAKNMQMMEVLDREYFNKIQEIIRSCYVNTEILMTKNKLLFADSSDDYKSDEEIKENIMKEFVEG
jgi:type III secretory pathway component EscV